MCIRDSVNSLPQHKINLLNKLDRWSYRTIGIGFPFLTMGIISGAVWANEAWGSYWSWDPKETWALITWLIFAIYLHSRLLKGWQGQKAAVLGSCGFFVIWICYLGVNFLGKGYIVMVGEYKNFSCFSWFRESFVIRQKIPFFYFIFISSMLIPYYVLFHHLSILVHLKNQ